jgi:hypothetical protein
MSSNLQDTFQLVSASHIADFHFANEGFDVYFHLIYCPPYSGMILSLGLGKKKKLKVKCIDSILIWTFPPSNGTPYSLVVIMLSFILWGASFVGLG